jgi:DNA-binding PadR family transcriptional regulator
MSPRVDLKPHHYHILLALADGPRHGLAIARDVQEISAGRVRLWPATLYGSLDDMRRAGWISEVDDPSERPEESERKRYYRITRQGRGVLAAETERLSSLVRLARSRAKANRGAL